MADGNEREEMRPIPDGGLKESMPSWLKRPPAWRSMPTAEERRERALPEPDTSQIDPRTLVDVSDLPQWLQQIAARGELKTPEPDVYVEHAVTQVQAAQAGTRTPVKEVPAVTEEPTKAEGVESKEIITPVASPESTDNRAWVTPGVMVAAFVIAGLLLLALLYL